MNTDMADDSRQQRLRDLPAVDALLHQPAIARLLEDHPRDELLHVIRQVLDDRRQNLRAGHNVDTEVPTLALEIRERLHRRARPTLRRVINATGIVLHTNLGRAPLAEEAVEAINELAAGYSNLELNLDTGRRGNRHDHLRDLLRELTTAEDAVVVNNNAAATYLTLNTLAGGHEVVISRGQLVEIGGSYRLPDIMSAAHCRMIEVGTTNRTRIADYERALTLDTRVLLRVHTSNYRIEGFTESATLAQLVELARARDLLVVDDLGSGLLTRDLPWPDASEDAARIEKNTPETFAFDSPIDEEDENDELPPPLSTWDEPTVRESIASGAHLTLFSGDKLLGGPQAGIIVGRADLIAAIRKNPLARTFRPGKLTLAALEATVRLYRDPTTVTSRLPVLRMLSRSPAALQAAAENLAQQIVDTAPDTEVFTESDYSEAGGGSLPTMPFPTTVVSVHAAGLGAETLADALRQHDPPIICRRRDDALIFDPRTLSIDDLAQIPPALAEAIRELN